MRQRVKGSNTLSQNAKMQSFKQQWKKNWHKSFGNAISSRDGGRELIAWHTRSKIQRKKERFNLNNPLWSTLQRQFSLCDTISITRILRSYSRCSLENWSSFHKICSLVRSLLGSFPSREPGSWSRFAMTAVPFKAWGKADLCDVNKGTEKVAVAPEKDISCVRSILEPRTNGSNSVHERNCNCRLNETRAFKLKKRFKNLFQIKKTLPIKISKISNFESLCLLDTSLLRAA